MSRGHRIAALVVALTVAFAPAAALAGPSALAAATPASAPSSKVALWLALGSTLGPALLATPLMLGGSFSSGDGGVVALVSGAVLAGAGLLVGPSIGHFYAGELRRGFGWLGLRALLFGAGAGLSVGGMILAADGEGVGFALVATGISAGVVGLIISVIDIVDAPAAARRARHRRRAPGASVQLVPLVALDDGTGVLRCGALLVGRF